MGFKLIIVLLLSFALVLTMTSPFAGVQPIDKVKSSAESIKVTQSNLTIGFAGVNIYSTTYSDPTGLFSGMANLFGSLTTLITDVMTPMASLPGPIYGFLIALLLILFIISVVGWWKGNEAG